MEVKGGKGVLATAGHHRGTVIRVRWTTYLPGGCRRSDKCGWTKLFQKNKY